MDFYRIRERTTRNGVTEIFPEFKVSRSKDLMVRGKQFHAIWDEEKQLWSTDEYDVARLIDQDLDRYKESIKDRVDGIIDVKYADNFSSNTWLQFRNYIGHVSDSSHQLDEKLVFSNTEIKKTDYITRRLPYSLTPGDISCYNEIISTLYEPEERRKIEWAIGAIVAGDAKHIQKFLVLYGPPGAGKGTIFEIIQKLFQGYYTTFDAKSLTGANNAFSTEAFKSNPMVAIDPDGDLSKIEDNTKLNQIVSHENMTINEKYKPSYMTRINAFLFMATNKPVKITDAKSGIIRRLIDVHPSGAIIAPKRYHALMGQIDFELGAIASHCLEVYREMGKNAYSGYRPIEMMLQTDIFFNFIETYYDLFKRQDGVSLTQAHELYREFCKDSDLEFKMPKYKLRTQLQDYFKNFEERAVVDDVRVRSWFSGFSAERFKTQIEIAEGTVYSLVMDETKSLLDEELAYMPAQYAGGKETPSKFWDKSERLMRDPADGKQKMMVPPDNLVVDTVLADLETDRIHYVKPPLNHIVIDFDLTDADGNKSAERNLEAASTWPATYAEYSKSGAGVHLHYIYDGDVSTLKRVYDDGIEIKVFSGNMSLRRKLSKCNNIPVATISSGLPTEEKKVLTVEGIRSEKALRDMIDRNLRKEIHPGTKPSIDFILKILEDAYHSDLVYDVSDYRPRLIAFANNSTNQAPYCLKAVMSMKFQSENVDPNPVEMDGSQRVVDQEKDHRLTYFDVEVFPNLFVISYSYEDSDQVVSMINPTAQAVEELVKQALIGYNVRRYDNHILLAAIMGYNNAQLYELSQKIINNEPGALLGQAYSLSYADVYDYAATKQSLKKWQIELGLKHDELGLPWDEPVPEELWPRVAEYCENDVRTLKQVAEHLKQDFVARQILAELSGLAVNEPTAKHTARIIFKGDRDFKEEFVYTDLSEMFPGYSYHFGKSTYHDEEVGEGGYVYAEPGIYFDTLLLDVASMHPTSIKELNLFGKYTDNFWDLVQARLAIKRKDFDAARKMLDGKLAPYLGTEKEAKALSYALKIVINIVYGLTSAKFDNPFRDPRNKDNIVAKRGALFMVDLKEAVQAQGYQVAHIKTDSIKIPNGDEKIKQFVMDFGKKYGYDFEHEKTYEKMALVNDAVYIAKIGWSADDPEEVGKWTATGKQFKNPYVFKKLFSKEQIEFKDLCVTMQVATAMYLDFTSASVPMAFDQTGERELQFVGKTGSFCPMQEGAGGGILLRQDKTNKEKFHAVTGTKGFFWLEAEVVQNSHKAHQIDMDYFETLVNEAIDTIDKFGDFKQFVDYIPSAEPLELAA